MNNRQPSAPTGPRYVARSRNGVWQVFDSVWYGVVGAEQTDKAANRRADNLNARKAQPQQARR